MISDSKYQLIYISPESVMTNLKWRKVLRSEVYKKHMVLFAVDEAHCVPSQHQPAVEVCIYIYIIAYCRGHFFCKEFSRLGEVRSLIPRNCPLMALTATQTRSNIIKILGMKYPHVITQSPHKPNMLYTGLLKRMECKKLFNLLLTSFYSSAQN